MDSPQALLLIVEDVADILELLEVTLKFKGYRVVTATNGQEALAAIQKERPALVITDILMPKMDGFSLVHHLKINPETRDLPVIFISATYVSPGDKEFAAAIGATHFIEKPIEINVLLQAIRELLAQKTLAAPAVIEESVFYAGYRQRLKTKLEEKMSQISRVEGMLDTLAEEEKPAFRKSLKQAIRERDEIRYLLKKIQEQVEKDTKKKRGQG